MNYVDVGALRREFRKLSEKKLAGEASIMDLIALNRCKEKLSRVGRTPVYNPVLRLVPDLPDQRFQQD